MVDLTYVHPLTLIRVSYATLETPLLSRNSLDSHLFCLQHHLLSYFSHSISLHVFALRNCSSVGIFFALIIELI